MRVSPSGALLIVAALSAVLALSVTGCGGGSSGSPSANKADAPAEEKQGAEPASHTPESCLEDVGVDTMAKPTPKSWRGVHSSGYVILIHRFGSPAAALRAVQAATDEVAYQANFYGVFGPVVDPDDGSTKAVALCLRGTP